ncbi:TRAP transporter large permease [Desulfovibrio sp. OttesenSCG-928-O18]|nr:TRAP transporter large permease [Desulfovibrio sp. OttesenSCG-928-O18]
MMVVFSVLALFLLFLSLRMALPLALGLAVVLFVMFDGTLPINVVWQTFFASFDSFPLLAIPFFMLSGDLMAHGGISKRLVNLALAWLGTVTGALGIVTVVCCMFFAAVSGSSPATVATIGTLLIPAMVKDGYDKSFAASLTICGGALGPIIPPSILFIIYGVTAEQSVSSLFLAGIGPGVLITLLLCAYVHIVAKKKNFGTKREPTPMPEKWKALREAIWSLLLPVIILGSIYSGIATPTEAAVVSSIYALFIGLFVHRDLNYKDLPEIFSTTACTTGYCLVSLGAAAAFAKLLTINAIPFELTQWIKAMTDSPILILMLINVVLLIAGCFIEPIPALIIFTPLMLPLSKSIGVDPIHFGVILVLNLTMGMCTPPVGVNLFVASGISNLPVHKMFKWLFPCLACLVIALLAVTYIPALSVGLVRLLN